MTSTGQESVNGAAMRPSTANKRKVLVTGGAGFIGSHLAAYFSSHGDEVVVLDNLSTGKRENIEDLDVHFVEGDIRDVSAVAEAVRGVNTVFHQAALCSVARSIADPVITHEVNSTGTLNILEASRKAGVRRVVFASSSSVYGDSEMLPKQETMPPAPLSPYAVSKLTGEMYGQIYWKLFGLETVALRYFNVFGPRQDPASDYAAVIPRFIEGILGHHTIQMYGDGCQTRDFTYVDNIVQANEAAATSAFAPGRVFNIACGGRWTLLELVRRIEALASCGATVEHRVRRAGDVLHSQASIVKAQALLRFDPTVDFEQGLKETIAWFQAADSARLPTLKKGQSTSYEKLGGGVRRH